MNNNNNNTGLLYKRAFAYFIDLIIICLVASVLTYWLPSSKKYMNIILEQADLSTEITQLDKDYEMSGSVITKEEYDATHSILVDKYNDLSYDSYKYSVDTGFITCAITFLYFGVMSYFLNGTTPGKKLMKLQVVSNNNKPLKITNFMIRTFLINRIYMDLIINSSILLMSKETFMKTYNSMSNILTLIWIASIFVAAFRLDSRGLHDLLANTKVISTRKQNVPETTETKEEPKEVKKIKCPYCNSKIDDNFDICPKCGNNIKQFEKENKKIKEAEVKVKKVKKSVKKEK